MFKKKFIQFLGDRLLARFFDSIEPNKSDADGELIFKSVYCFIINHKP